jgi:hypothetical protein
MSNETPSPAQIRAALAILKWENDELAAAADIGTATAFNVKMGNNQPQPRIRAKIRKALEDQGIEFTDFDGVRRRPEGIDVLNGPEGLSKFLDGVYEHLKEHGGNVMVTGVLDEQWTKYGGDHILNVHVPRMVKLCSERKDIEVLSLCPEGSHKFDYDSYTKYRTQPKQLFDSVPFYVYGDNLAIIIFQAEPPPKIIFIRSSVVAQAYRNQFSQLWGLAKEMPKRRDPTDGNPQ